MGLDLRDEDESSTYPGVRDGTTPTGVAGMLGILSTFTVDVRFDRSKLIWRTPSAFQAAVLTRP